MFKLQVQDDDNDPTIWRDVNGPSGQPLTFDTEAEARTRLEALYPVLVKMERYAGPKRTRVIKILHDDEDR